MQLNRILLWMSPRLQRIAGLHMVAGPPVFVHVLLHYSIRYILFSVFTLLFIRQRSADF